jgi:hypothetical protein
VKEALPDVPGLLDPWCCLKDDSHKHQGLLRVPVAGLNAAELRGKGVDKAATHLSLWDRIVGHGEVDNPRPLLLPCYAPIHATV